MASPCHTVARCGRWPGRRAGRIQTVPWGCGAAVPASFWDVHLQNLVSEARFSLGVRLLVPWMENQETPWRRPFPSPGLSFLMDRV